MGKIKEDEETSNRRHKKHKRHRHKKDADADSLLIGQNAEMSSPQPSIKLKIKIGGQLVGSQSFTVENDDQEIFTDVPMNISHCEEVTSADWNESQVLAKKGDETSDEEREWLDALEAGKLDDNGELKKQKDTSMLTARQKALLHGERVEELQELSTNTFRPAALTEEQLNRRQLRAKRRREQAQEKTEKDKQETLDRLLKKHDSKIKTTNKGPIKEKSLNIPTFRYVNSSSSVTISVPVGYEHPFLTPKYAPEPKPVVNCGVDGCPNPKNYTCSKTGIPLCSLECYKRNLSIAPPTTPVTVAGYT